ncbi:phosphate signaling complex protein PhoU [Nocardioides cavernaquae]|uniref:Phosphate-specific transport system accessory protein PhoU n=1 Tax=Nocardioides cavernaquae TaxID=2321396 RepID=A0A3A5HEH1_9ACTN|nr:phosphate signaling complex protein PhoU [Nocardioides cavernaquae]RJS46287.1 phosphate transport system regulatory protein PhoU [Nocardioides cavernaquae]
MRDAYSDQLDAIFDDLATIASDVKVAVARATTALLTGDAVVAEQVISADVVIDTRRERVEDRSFSLLSLQQPVAGDLRTIVAALRMVADLERAGDLAVHVAKIARLRVPGIAVPEDVRPMVQRMAEIAEEMVGRTARIIAERDIDGATALAKVEDEMDNLRAQMLRDLLGSDWSHGVESAVDLALLGRYYERIGDHAVSVANRVVYVVTGVRPSRD